MIRWRMSACQQKPVEKTHDFGIDPELRCLAHVASAGYLACFEASFCFSSILFIGKRLTCNRCLSKISTAARRTPVH